MPTVARVPDAQPTSRGALGHQRSEENFRQLFEAVTIGTNEATSEPRRHHVPSPNLWPNYHAGPSAARDTSRPVYPQPDLLASSRTQASSSGPSSYPQPGSSVPAHQPQLAARTAYSAYSASVQPQSGASQVQAQTVPQQYTAARSQPHAGQNAYNPYPAQPAPVQPQRYTGTSQVQAQTVPQQYTATQSQSHASQNAYASYPAPAPARPQHGASHAQAQSVPQQYPYPTSARATLQPQHGLSHSQGQPVSQQWSYSSQPQYGAPAQPVSQLRAYPSQPQYGAPAPAQYAQTQYGAQVQPSSVVPAHPPSTQRYVASTSQQYGYLPAPPFPPPT
ncbi:hypothetical protein OF83DRAFT_718517 [Amylostereum chailletii]|nr:hypothetical protein OF83DRAFT_718517 [Amylostereum chailletii]